MEFPISEENERYGDLTYREERTYLGVYDVRTRFQSFYQGPLFWSHALKAATYLINLLNLKSQLEDLNPFLRLGQLKKWKGSKVVLLRYFLRVDDQLMLCECRSPGGPLEIGLTQLGQL